MDRLLINDALLTRVGYDARKQDLEVVLENRTARLYIGVPPSVYLAMMQSDNVGDYFRSKVEGAYVYQSIPLRQV